MPGNSTDSLIEVRVAVWHDAFKASDALIAADRLAEEVLTGVDCALHTGPAISVTGSAKVV